MNERQGLDKILKEVPEGEEFDILGAKTYFRAIVEGVVEQTVSQNKWFSFCTRISEKQYDIMSFKNKQGEKLGKMVASFYEETVYRSAIYKYMLKDYLCYYEAPAVKRYNPNSAYNSTYDKYLVTSNLYVVARWLDISLEEANFMYGSRVEEALEDNGCDMFPYLKLYETKEGVRKVSKPRKDLDLSVSGTRVIPLFALKKGVDLLYELCSKDFYSVTFAKDGGQIREINTTFDAKKLRDIYGEGDFWSSGVEGMYDGDFLSNPKLERGYIRVFEAGASKYDTPLRSINYARIISIEKKDPDLSYVNIDLESATTEFLSGIDSHPLEIESIVEMLDIFDVGTERMVGGNNKRRLQYVEDFNTWIDNQKLLLSTVFLRQLALFMLGNPQWFSDYTGGNVDTTSSSVVPTESIDVEDDFEFDFA